MAGTSEKIQSRLKRKARSRDKVRGTAERPRLSVFRSARHIYAQIVDDDLGAVLASASTVDKQVRTGTPNGGNVNAAREVGLLIAQRALDRKIESVTFDRGGFRFHGRVKALAEAAREGGLKF